MLILLACALTPAPAGPRVVSLHDTTTEMIVALGRANELVAVMEPEFLSEAALLAVANVPRVSAPVSKEALLALQPTLILGTEDVPQHQPELADLGRWIDPVGLDGLWSSIETVGQALGAPTAPYVDGLKARLPAPVAGELPAFVYDCCDPPFTMGARAPLTEILARMGAKNVFSDLDQDWGRVSWEAAMVRKPALVIIDDYAGEGDVPEKVNAVQAHLGEVPTVVLPLSLALEGPRLLEAPSILAPAIEAAR